MRERLSIVSIAIAAYYYVYYHREAQSRYVLPLQTESLPAPARMHDAAEHARHRFAIRGWVRASVAGEK